MTKKAHKNFAILIVSLSLIIQSAIAAVESSTVAEMNPFEALESKIYEAPGLTFSFDINSSGAVTSNLRGEVKLCSGNRVSIRSQGEIFDQPITSMLEAVGNTLKLNGRELQVPAELNESIMVGLLRMGLLHNLVRLGGDFVPDHAGGGVEDWVQVPVVGVSGDRLFFDVLVSGQRAGKADLILSKKGWPQRRVQTVYFGTEEMKVIEIYSGFSLSCQL
jgi:hypothetical protein